MRKDFLKKFIVICLSAIICISSIPIQALAVTTSYTPSASYKSGKYYTNLLSVSLTGNQATDLVNVAKSQLGYHESDSNNDLSGEATTSTKKYNEYGYMHGNANDDWCAYFVSWCARQARIPTSIIPKTGGAGTMRTKAGTYYDVTSGYLPKKGDLILFEPKGTTAPRNSSTGLPSVSSHVAIITDDCNDGMIRIIEGNNNDRVMTRTFKYTTTLGNSHGIQGYLHPNYNNSTTADDNENTITNIASSIKVTADSATNITTNNATLNGTCTKPSSAVKIKTCGVYVGTSTSNMKKKITETVSTGANDKNNGTSFSIWYDVNSELGMTLSAGTTYYYKFYCTYGDSNTEITSGTKSFTTKSAAVYTTQDSRVYINGGTPAGYSTATGSNKTATFSDNSYFPSTQYVDLSNGTRRFKFTDSNGTVYWIQYDSSYMTVQFLPKSISAPESHIYLNTESNTTYTFSMNFSPANSKDSISIDHSSYDYNIATAGYSGNGVYTICAEGIGTTEITLKGYYTGLTTTIKVTVVDGGAPVFNSITATDTGNDSYKIRAEVKDLEIARFGVKTWHEDEDEEDLAITWYNCNFSFGSYEDLSYSDPNTSGDYIVTHTVKRENLDAAGGTYLTAIYAEDSSGNVSRAVVDYYVEPSYNLVQLPYTDVTENDWFCDYVKYVYAEEIMGSTSTTEMIFSPSKTLTRAEFSQILYRLNGAPEIDYVKGTFDDVNGTEWYAKAAMWAKNTGIVTGYGNDTTFAGTITITREQFVVMLQRYSAYTGHDVDQTVDLSIYPDCNDVSGWAKDAVTWAVANGIISGNSKGELKPQGTTSRAECATMITRYMELY